MRLAKEEVEGDRNSIIYLIYNQVAPTTSGFFDVRLNGTYFQYEEIINVKRTSLILRQKVIQTCILFLGKTFPSTLYSKSQIRSVAFMFFSFV